MTGFDRLHPAVQHHVVNTMGWRGLRPLQEASIEPIHDGRHALLLAPTAGGKTEAAVLPLLSRMLTEEWGGLSVLYVCPIKALLNNLDVRLSRYCGMVGRRSGLWHGDIGSSVRGRILAEPPDLLLTTPESLEVMLLSRKTDKAALFGRLRAIVVDEVHAFAGDDRGWHLLSVVERLSRFAGRELQRIGLSATVGNPDELLGWLAGACDGRREVVAPEAPAIADVEAGIDYVGSLSNAAVVVSRLHAGEKRLVFCDSRARVEELGARLRALGVETYVSHSSLNVDDRRRAEEAFATGSDCVIVATSTLELGIDVGDLDRVLQIDAPTTVSSLLQRMGRTGRRAGTRRNCLMLATTPDALVRGAGLLRLWQTGYVEPVTPPSEPFHVFAQQVMALALQEGGLGERMWRDWIGRVPAFQDLSDERAAEILGYMIDRQVLFDEDGLLWFGTQGEATYGRKNFLELFSVFYCPPLFTVRHGQREIGWVHELSFLTKSASAPVLLLGGRSWTVTHLDWRRRVAYVEPAEDDGRSRWLGSGQPLSLALSRSIRSVLATDEKPESWSRRAGDEIERVRGEHPWLDRPENPVVTRPSSSSTVWWTFAGQRANAMLGERLESLTRAKVTFDNLRITVDRPMTGGAFDDCLQVLRVDPPAEGASRALDAAIEGMKFADCLPIDLARKELRGRLADRAAVARLLSEDVRYIADAG